MPSWLSSSLINQARGLIGQRQPSAIEPSKFSGPVTSNEEESEYEEIEQIHNYSNMNANPRGPSAEGQGSPCALCGNMNPLVICEMCNNQLFCASCNDMFHRHPRRHNHRRKLLEPMENRPRLPSHPQEFRQEFPEGPVPPPRRMKGRGGLGSANASPTLARRFPFDPMGSLKRFVGSKQPVMHMPQRPLPIPPFSQRNPQFTKPGPNPTRMNPGTGTWDRRQSAPFQTVQHQKTVPFQNRSGSIAAPGFGGREASTGYNCIPLTVMELEQSRRNQNTAKRPDKYCLPPSRDSGWDEEEEEIMPRGQRAFSVSACNLQEFPASSADHSHFATLQRRGSSKPPARPPPPVPPRDFSLSRSMHPAASAFELDRSNCGAFVPWVNSQHHQGFSGFDLGQGLPYANEPRRQTTLQRNQSSLDQAMSLVELNLRDFSRFDQPAYGNQPTETCRPYPGSSLGHRPMTPRHSDSGSSHRPMSPRQRDSGFANRPMTPRRMTPAPPLPPPPPVAQPEPDYYSGDDGDLSAPVTSMAAEVDLEDFTESPEGPWTCEHCTFINPKSTRVCTVCCKTPVKGYQIVHSYERTTKKKSKNRGFDLPRSIDPELSPVIQSTLTFSTNKSHPIQKVVLNNVEKVRKHTTAGHSRSTAVAVPAYESSNESDSNSSSSSDEITEKHRSLVRENKSNTLKKDKNGDGNDLTNFQTAPNQAQNIWNSSLLKTKMVDSSTGDYSILDSDYLEKRNILKNEAATSPSQSSSEAYQISVSKIEQKSSKGTSPPPQTISTQTYEELPGPSSSKMKSEKSISKISLQSSIQSRESSPPREMSEKALRYARRAQQHSQLKRSMSTHLTSVTSTGTNDAWGSASSSHRQPHHEGRHLYRSSSRQSLASDTRSLPVSGPPSRDISPPPDRHRFDDYGARNNRFGPMAVAPWDRFPCPADYFASIDDIVGRKRRESAKSQQEFELSRLLKEAEELNYTPEDVQVGLRMCGGDRNPIKWLEDNWANMVETVQALATKFGRDKGQDFNEVGTISAPEAKEALRMHKGNVWAAVTECVEQRRKKFVELQSRGSFLREDVLTALTAHKGNLDAAYVELSKNQLKPFLMRIWGPPSGKDNESVPPPRTPPDNFPVVAPPLPQPLPPVEPQATESLVSLKSVPEDSSGPISKIDESLPLNSSDSMGTPELSPLSPEINETKENSRSEELLKGDVEEDTFYDLDPVPSALSVDGDLDIEDSEAHVSDFIQNYDIPQLPPPSPIPASPVIKPEDSENKPEKLTETNEKRFAGTRNPGPISPGLNDTEIHLLEESTSAVSTQAIVTLSKAVNLIAEKLGVLLKNQQIGAENSSETKVNQTQEKVDKIPEKVSKIQEKVTKESQIFPTLQKIQNEKNLIESEFYEEKKIAPESTPFHPIISEVETLKEIYKEELNLLKDIVLSEDKSVKKSQQKVTQVESLALTQGQVGQVNMTEKRQPEVPHVTSAIPQGQVGQVNMGEKRQPELSNVTSAEPQGIPQGQVGQVNMGQKSHPEVLSVTSATPQGIPQGQVGQVNMAEKREPELPNVTSATPQSIPQGQVGHVNLAEKPQSKNVNPSVLTSGTPVGQAPRISSAAPGVTPGQEKSYESVAHGRQSRSSKIYEVLGNLAGTFLRSGSSKSKISKSPIVAQAEPEENLYETISVSGGGMEVVPKVDFLPEGMTLKLTPERGLFEEGAKLTSGEAGLTQELTQEGQELTQEAQELTREWASISQNSPNFFTPDPDTTKFDISRMSSLAEQLDSILNSADDLTGIHEIDHEFLDNSLDESESEIDLREPRSDLEEYLSGDESIADDGLDTKWAEVAYALNEATAFQESPSNFADGVQLLLNSGRVTSAEKAELALKLMDMNFSESDSIHAANECSSLYTAISFLQQECYLCTGKFSAKQMISMLRCSHACCRNCATEYFMVQIRDQSILSATCPFCKEPSNLTEDSDQATDYFSHLEILLKDILPSHWYEMFGRKLRDWTLAQTPNFKWCSKCSSGFITDPLQTHLICPDCNAVTCAICLEPWDKFNHEHRDQSHVEFCDPNVKGQLKSIVDYLNEKNLECPKCHLKFALARGGCMHLTCSQCRYEFCSGCLAPFAMGLKCKENASFCAKLGLHAHHPRNCLFYLRDKEPELLIKLLKESNVEFVENTEAQAQEPSGKKSKCVVALQKETPEGLIDETCGQDVTKEGSEICQTHFTEYLGLLVWENRLDPIPILTNDDLETIVKRACKKMPPRSYGKPDSEYRPLLLKVIEDEIPL